MALSAEDLAALGEFVRKEVSDGISAFKGSLPEAEKAAAPTAEEAVNARVAQVGAPDVAPDAGPEYYVHLANGKVITTHDSASTHIADPDDGSTQLVIGRFQVGS